MISYYWILSSRSEISNLQFRNNQKNLNNIKFRICYELVLVPYTNEQFTWLKYYIFVYVHT